MMSVASSTTPPMDWNSGRSLDGTKQGAAQGVADGGAKSALKRLRAELAKGVGKRLGIHCQALRFLKSSPKHIVVSFPARHVRRDAFCGGRASSPSVEMQLLAFSSQLLALSLQRPRSLA